MHPKLRIPDNYSPLLNLRETEEAIRLIKEFFQTNLAFELNLKRVTAPLFVQSGRGINDDLNGIEKAVSFSVKDMGGVQAEIVHSLAKWKRFKLAEYGYGMGEGIYTDMNAIRSHEILDNLHSLYVDQWDWERVMSPQQRTLAYLKQTVRVIYAVIKRTELFVSYHYPQIEAILPREILFIHSEELERMYPELSPVQREARICREHGAVFVTGIGAPLANGAPHDGRAPDYDDWSTINEEDRSGLNGDILIHYPLLDCSLELSSMGIRVDPGALLRQLELRGETKRKELMFHSMLLNGLLPQTIGGGIGQSRLCMFYLRKAHIGEIQASLWPEQMIEQCAKNQIQLL